ncbi:hypothetical protein COLO4_35384 [Corchorus olitorius]|uniref:Uncharacterized protein n=1 Tax=Corchorus olitorius TaxID=93759 RepID=A0A1R3GH68_9ROSI|nr:hypothetical protein COLO4_35384 [Corchorus olitorius]
MARVPHSRIPPLLPPRPVMAPSAPIPDVASSDFTLTMLQLKDLPNRCPRHAPLA